MNSGNITEKHPSGAKAPVDSAGIMPGINPRPTARACSSAARQAARIRRMSPEDLDRVMEIAASLKEAPHWTCANYAAVLDPAATPRRIALVTDGGQAGQVVGLAVASLIPPQAELETIAVDTHFQRSGLARGLFAELAGRLALGGVTEVILEVRASNQAALGLYRRLGFVETGRRPRYYQAPAEDAVLMRLEGFKPEAANGPVV
jgi:ribosomal-protein-alanine N-acetyltransferase